MICPSCRTENDPAARKCVSCGASLPRGGLEGSLVAGRYEIRSCLGKGGMGVVYRAYDRELEEIVAIKVLLDRDPADAIAARRFRSEIKLARKVTHRNVCRIHDYGRDGGVEYISMQFVEGTDLRERVRRHGGLPAEEAYEVALQVSEGLQAVHDEGIVHRDLKAANVMIDAQGVARLMDFGIAKDTAGGESLTDTGFIVGTPDYMSPEQIHSQELDPRSDIYSLGVILFELFTGRVPFTGDTPIGLLMKHLQEAPPVDTAAIPPGAREVIRRAMAKDRGQRYGSARELAAALRAARAAAASATPAAATIPSRPPIPTPVPTAPAPSPARRWRWPLIALGSVVLIPTGLWLGYRASLSVLTTPASPSPSAPLAAPPATGATVATLPRGAAGIPSPAPPTPARALETCQDGRAAACAEEGQRYEAGAGVVRDDRRAAAAYRRACDLGAANGCTRLGVLYNSGRGVEKDVAAAAGLYEKACAGNDGPGCNNLGTTHEFGVIGFGPDLARAAGYYRRACDLGDAQGCGNLALVSLANPGLAAADRDAALRLLRQACSGNAPRACRKLQELGLAP